MRCYGAVAYQIQALLDVIFDAAIHPAIFQCEIDTQIQVSDPFPTPGRIGWIGDGAVKGIPLRADAHGAGGKQCGSGFVDVAIVPIGSPQGKPAQPIRPEKRLFAELI